MQVKLGSSSPILGVKIKNIWNHHLVFNTCGAKGAISDPFRTNLTHLSRKKYPSSQAACEGYLLFPRFAEDGNPQPMAMTPHIVPP